MRTCPRCSSLYVNDVLCCGLDGERLVDVDRDPLLGTTLDRYQIQATLGHGGMARVYRAQHAHLGHAVALKVLHGDTASDRRRVERFRREAATAAQLHHPNVVQVHDFGVSPDGLVFMAMELLEGATLAQRLEEGRRFVPSEIAEDEVMCAVAAVPGTAFDPAALIEFLVPRLAHFMIPRYVRTVEALPKTPTQKVQKHLLRSEGITADTWDREAAGIRIRRQVIGG